MSKCHKVGNLMPRLINNMYATAFCVTFIIDAKNIRIYHECEGGMEKSPFDITRQFSHIGKNIGNPDPACKKLLSKNTPVLIIQHPYSNVNSIVK